MYFLHVFVYHDTFLSIKISKGDRFTFNPNQYSCFAARVITLFIPQLLMFTGIVMRPTIILPFDIPILREEKSYLLLQMRIATLLYSIFLLLVLVLLEFELVLALEFNCAIFIILSCDGFWTWFINILVDGLTFLWILENLKKNF